MRETRNRKGHALSTEVVRFERGRGSNRKSRIQDDYPVNTGHPGNGYSVVFFLLNFIILFFFR